MRHTKAEAAEIHEALVELDFRQWGAQPEPEQEPVAWRTFDGEGGYDYRPYEDNESYADDWNKRNPNHVGWVDKLYTTPPQRTWVGLTDKVITQVIDSMPKKMRGFMVDWDLYELARAIEAKLKDKSCAG